MWIIIFIVNRGEMNSIGSAPLLQNFFVLSRARKNIKAKIIVEGEKPEEEECEEEEMMCGGIVKKKKSRKTFCAWKQKKNF